MKEQMLVPFHVVGVWVNLGTLCERWVPVVDMKEPMLVQFCVVDIWANLVSLWEMCASCGCCQDQKMRVLVGAEWAVRISAKFTFEGADVGSISFGGHLSESSKHMGERCVLVVEVVRIGRLECWSGGMSGWNKCFVHIWRSKCWFHFMWWASELIWVPYVRDECPLWI